MSCPVIGDFMTGEKSNVRFGGNNSRVNLGQLRGSFFGGVDVIISSNAPIAGNLDERYCDRDGGQSGEEGMDTIERGGIQDLWEMADRWRWNLS